MLRQNPREKHVQKGSWAASMVSAACIRSVGQLAGCTPAFLFIIWKRCGKATCLIMVEVDFAVGDDCHSCPLRYLWSLHLSSRTQLLARLKSTMGRDWHGLPPDH